MKTIIRYSLLMLCATMACVSCHERNVPTPIEAPSWKAEEIQQESISWSVADDAIDITSRMYLIVNVNLKDSVTKQDKLSAWYGEECVSVTQPVSTPDGLLFYMIINRPKAGESKRITLAYYSSKSGKVTYWPNLFWYQHDGVLGSAEEPYSLPADKSSAYRMSSTIHCTLPDTIQAAEGDEMAVFVEDHCRLVIDPLVKNGQYNTDYSFQVPLFKQLENIHIHYFSRETGKIYISGNIAAIDELTMILTPIPFD